MASFLFVILTFLSTFVFHILIHRLGVKKSPLVYFVGLFGLIWALLAGFVGLPWLSVILYTCLSLITTLFYVALTLGTQLPTSAILASFNKKHKQSFEDLTGLFSDTGLISNRLDGLMENGMIYEKDGKMHIAERGEGILRIIDGYRRIFNRSLTE